jgi:hypothetical protein
LTQKGKAVMGVETHKEGEESGFAKRRFLLQCTMSKAHRKEA